MIQASADVTQIAGSRCAGTMEEMAREGRAQHGDGTVAVASAWGIAAILVSAVILFARQSPDALMRSSSFGGALATVAFWDLPALAVYVAFARSRLIAFVEGAAFTGLLSTQ